MSDRIHIGEVCKILKIKPYVLRYWEKEIPEVAPRKDRTGSRTYDKSDVRKLLRIKHFLYRRRFTIEGARREFLEELGYIDLDFRASAAALRDSLIELSLKTRESRRSLDKISDELINIIKSK